MIKKLKRKGFDISHKKKHYFMMFYYNGKKTRAHTIINLRPKKVIGKGLFSTISKQLYLENPELIELLDCPMSQDDYIKILMTKEILKK